jgi:hypothetical protein
MDQAMTASQENLEEAILLMNQNAAASMELLEKAFEGGPLDWYPDAQVATQELWKSGLEALRTDIQSVVDANARAMQSWAKTFKLLTDENPGNGRRAKVYRGNGH